jgi:PAS domain S-box-containing protein
MSDKILLVVQEPAFLAELVEIVQGWGHRPLEAASVGESWGLMAEHRPPFALLDNSLGITDSLELLRDLKDEYPACEVIYLVDWEQVERGVYGLEFGASDMLVKPVSANRLAVALKRAQERLTIKRKLTALTGDISQTTPYYGDNGSISEKLDDTAACVGQLYDTKQKYEQLFDEVPCYITVINRRFELTAANRRFKEDFGDAVGGMCYKLYKNEDEPCADCPVTRTFRDGQSHQYEQVVTSQSGEQYNVLTSTAPLRDARGEIGEVMSMSTNITEIRRLQDHLSSLGMLIGSISHAIKGLLTALDGGMYKVRSGVKRGDQTRIEQGWELVELMVGRIRRTVLDVLFYAKDRALDLEWVDVADFARQVTFTGTYAAKRHGFTFYADIPDDLGEFEVDPNALNPAIINILENAVDACLDDREKEHHTISFRVRLEYDIVVFDIEDDGKGMDENTKENMFTLFYSSKGSAGTGLGLFIANDTVAQHRGTITVDSEPGQGSHFHVRIPVRPRAMRSGEKTPPTRGAAA